MLIKRRGQASSRRGPASLTLSASLKEKLLFVFLIDIVRKERTRKRITQSLKKFPSFEFKMLKAGLVIPEMSKPLPIKKFHSQRMKCLRKDDQFAGCFLVPGHDCSWLGKSYK